MSLLQNMKMGAIAGNTGLRLLGDALGDITGHSMPFRAEQVEQPAVLTRMVNEGALSVLGQPVHITGIRRQAIPAVSSNCQNLVLTIEQSGRAILPDSVFVKLPMESLLTRGFMNVISSWRLESHFFRHVAPGLPLRTPVTFATDWRGSRFFLVQENLRADPDVTLFTNLDMITGPTLEQARQCLDAFARLHAFHYGMEREQQLQILPLDYHPFLSPTMGVVSRNLNRLALQPCMKKRPAEIPAALAAAYRLTLTHWDDLLEHWFSGPLSLLHGDSHLGNFFATGEKMGMLDWQAAHWGKGMRDVLYFLVDALPADILAAHEAELVQYYVESRARYGEPIDAVQAWQDYRSFSFHALMTIVVSIGFGALNEEQDALMLEILRRAVAASERLDYAGWLHEFLQR